MSDRNKDILTEREFYENTMGCFYQDELRKHDRAMRKALSQRTAEIVEMIEGMELGRGHKLIQAIKNKYDTK